MQRLLERGDRLRYSSGFSPQKVITGWPVKHQAIGIFSWAKASFTATERSLRS